jgi:translation initiation factor IF-3
VSVVEVTDPQIPRSDVAIAPVPDQSEHRINERIRASEVRLIDPEGNQLGVKPLQEALNIARQLDLDLVEVAADAKPPVCRIMDFNRFKYEAAQRAKESRKKTTSTSIKEMKYRPKIGTGDFDTKTRQVARFLGEGHKVKITIMFRGREMSHPELGKKILDHVAETVGEVAKVEMAPKLDGRNMIMVLAPDRRAQQAAAKAAQTAANGSSPAAATNGAQPSATTAVPAAPVPAAEVPAAVASEAVPAGAVNGAPALPAGSNGNTPAPAAVPAVPAPANGTAVPAAVPAGSPPSASSAEARPQPLAAAASSTTPAPPGH